MKRGFKILKAAARIYFFHIAAGLAIWLSMYFPFLDIILAILYIVLLREEGKHDYNMLKSYRKLALVAFIWQIPGLILGTSVIIGLDRLTEFAYYFVFILELWMTPVLPIISLIPAWTIFSRPLYYYLLFLMVPTLAIIYYLPACRIKAEKS